MFCLAAAEIERYGKPLIVSNYKALSERVVNNETGYLIDDGITLNLHPAWSLLRCSFDTTPHSSTPGGTSTIPLRP